jgi:hypothetical protein
MNLGIPQRCAQPTSTIIAVIFFLLLSAVAFGAQRGQRGAAAGPPRPAREAAPIDLTGYWVSVVSEDWRVRMVVAQKGDWQFMPLNAEGSRAAMANNPAAEDPCKAYGAAGIMRIPTRLHITWDNDSTLHIDTDAGKQTRLFHFGQAQTPAGAPSLQGYSVAQWEARASNPDVGGKQSAGGELKVVTTRMTPGYYFKHGVPYSGNAVLTEYFARLSDGPIDYLMVSTVVDDPQYLTQPFAKTLVFKREPDGSKWNPAPCSIP